MTQEEIAKYTDHLLAEFYKDCQKQYNKDYRQIDIVLSNGDFSTLQNIMCEAIINNQNKLINKACEWLKKHYTNYMIQDLSKYVEDVCSFDIFSNSLVDDFRKSMEE